MPGKTIACDQAIFTSARGPTGEGYRIVGASKGLRTEEKQKITRCSPSHESLCTPGESATTTPVGAAFYALPGGRFCIALSRHAGAEHTGRGGQRVFTHNLILSDHELGECGGNPFAIIRAMANVPMEIQKLSTCGSLPQFELQVDETQPKLAAEAQSALSLPARAAAIELFLEGKPLIVDVAGDWIAWAEALILAVPVPLRFELSFAAGIKFSTGRGHTLHLIRDEKNAAQARATAQGIAFVGPKSEPPAGPSQWRNLVERFWSNGDLRALSRRTSRYYEDCSQSARERIADVYNQLDSVSQFEPGLLLDLVSRSLQLTQGGAEGEVRREFRDAAQQQLRTRLCTMHWPQIKPMWNRMAEMWRAGGANAAFVQPLLGPVLLAALRSDPAAAAELSLILAQAPGGADKNAHESMLQQFFTRLSATVANTTEGLDQLPGIMQRWRAVRPVCPIVAQLCERLTPAQT